MLKRITQAPISIRLPFLIVTSLILAIVLAGNFYYREFRNISNSSVKSSVQGLARYAEGNLNNWLSGLLEEVDALSSDKATVEAIVRFGRLSNTATAPSLGDIRRAYITENPNPAGERQNLIRGADFTPYDFTHAEFHSYFRQVLERSGYYDLFLILPNGEVIYSVSKEDDFGTNILDGQYSDSGLGDVFQRSVTGEAGQAVFSDFRPYAPSANAPASFMAEQILNAQGEIIGVIAIQLPISAMNDVLLKNLELTPSDEIYLIGADGFARSTPKQPGLFNLLDAVPDLEHYRMPPNDQYDYYQDVQGLSGERVVALTTSINVLGERWAIVVERSRQIAFAALSQFLKLTFIFTGIGTLLAIIVGYFAARSITKPLKVVTASMEDLSNENYDTEVQGMNRRDEFGKVSKVLDDFRHKLIFSRDAEEEREVRREDMTTIVTSLGDGLTALAGGDLTKHIDQPFSDEYETLRSHFNETVENMTKLIRQIVENAHEIHLRSEEIGASSDDLSMRTESQAATLEETAAALDELTSSVREAADSATEVEGVVTNARNEAEESGKVVAEAVDAMSTIRKSSNEISQIIGVIDDIAFQTNLLSLNAGVEAARAGDAGRGFAVVASEVRALAQRSSEAAKQIKSLITSSSEQVETGVGLVGRAGDALGSIIDRVGSIDALMNGIATGSREQSIGLGEINIGMSQLDQVTQQNAAMVEEASAAAATLRTEAGHLSQIVSKFKLDETDGNSFEGAAKFAHRSSNVEDFPKPIPQPLSEPTKMVVNSSEWKDF